jgi:gluconate 2-dehydrogenase gamma chain
MTSTKASDASSRGPASRRAFIAKAAGLAALVPLSARAGAAEVADPSPTGSAPSPSSAGASQPPDGYTFFGPEEATFVEALMNVMCPADSLTPSGTECGLPIYIDRQLAGDFGKGGRLYSQGPWVAGKPQHGYQLPMKPAEFFTAGIVAASAAARSRYDKSFDALTPQDADAFLQDIAMGKVTGTPVSLADWFSVLVYPLFQQACFADPVYGGNRGKVFWRMVGYPGLPALHAQDMVQFRGKPYPAARQPQSIQDFS